MEIEAKFTIPNHKVYAQLEKIQHIQGFTIHVGNTQTFSDAYLDTPERHIMRAGYAYRIRRPESTNTLTLTLKALCCPKDVLHCREEFEAQIQTRNGSVAATTPHLWPPNLVQQQILNIIGDHPLEIVCTLQQQRHTRPITRNQQRVAEFSLDTVRQRYQQAQQTYQELEIELKAPGTVKDLHHLIKHLVQTHVLSPQSVSKFERGLAFISLNVNQALRDTPQPVPPITPNDHITEAGYKALRFHFQRMLHNETGTILGQDIEALHDMRVATRQMRAVLYTFKPYLDKKPLKPYRQWLKRTTRVLGAVRDMDVFCDKTHSYLQDDKTPTATRADLEPVFRAWNTAYDKARAALLAYLSQRDYIQFKERFAIYLREVKPTLPPSASAIQPYQVKDIAPILIYQRLAAVRAYAGWLTKPNVPLARYHQLRIVTKYLRYTLEFFQHALPAEAATAISDIKKLQTHLGDLQDAAVTCERLHNIQHGGQWEPSHAQSTSPTQLMSGLEHYYAYKQEEIQHLRATFPDLWSYYPSPKFSKLMAAVVGGL